jgi:hypothetical protein
LQHRPDVLNRFQTTDDVIEEARISREQKCRDGAESFVDHLDIHARSEKVLAEKVLALRCTSEVVE